MCTCRKRGGFFCWRNVGKERIFPRRDFGSRTRARQGISLFSCQLDELVAPKARRQPRAVDGLGGTRPSVVRRTLLVLQFEAVSHVPDEERRIIKALLDGMISKYQTKQMMGILSS